MGPALAGFLADFGVALTKWGLSELNKEREKAAELAEEERVSGVRNGKNALKYQSVQTRIDQVRAAVDLLNRNN